MSDDKEIEPTLIQLESAFNNCCLAFAMGDIGAPAEALVRLRRLREAKHTWIGDRENQFRFMVDGYLREYNQ